MTTIVAPGPADVAALAAQVSGPVLTAEGAEYAEEVAGFNLATTHQPAVVVGATCTDDVANTVRWAAGLGLPVGVQATGHGACTVIDQVLVSTRRMQDLVIDPVARTARIGAGVRWRSVVAAAGPHGLAPLVGSSSDVGAVGYTLGGGLPVLGRVFGYASDDVVCFETVTAAGEVVQVDADHFADLFWALRGGKGNLGIVTSMTIELHQIPRLYGGGIFYPGERSPEVLRGWRDWALGLPQDVCTSVAILRLPPAPELPDELRGRFVVHVRYAHLGEAATAEALLTPMRRFGPALLDNVGEMPYTAIDSIHQDPDHPLPIYERGLALATLDDSCLEAILDRLGPDATTTVLMLELRLMGGAQARAPRVADAVGGRDALCLAFAVGVLAPPIADRVPADIDALVTALSPYGTGRTLVNLHGRPGDQADRARPWPPTTYARLRELKDEYDPANLFRFGHALVG